MDHETLGLPTVHSTYMAYDPKNAMHRLDSSALIRDFNNLTLSNTGDFFELHHGFKNAHRIFRKATVVFVII